MGWRQAINENRPSSMIAHEIEAIFAGQDVGDGDVDVDGVLDAFARLVRRHRS